MSGTSIDSVDYAICSFAGGSFVLRSYWQVAFPRGLRERLISAAANRSSTYEIAQLHHDLGRFFAKGAERAGRLDLVGLHGQTVFHNPRQPGPATFQIGEAAYLAEALQVPVVSNFRAADVAAGGQGAPLATIFHCYLFAARGQHVAVNNLGGISNVTSLDWTVRSWDEPRVLAFDTGPANMLIDLAARHFSGERRPFDRGGAWARRGKASDALIKAWLKQPFFRVEPPKSTGRELFGETFFKKALSEMSRRRLSAEDILATFTEFSAATIAQNYRLYLPSIPDTVILAGGGASNEWLVTRIRERLSALREDVEVVTSDQRGWPDQSIEPAAFALLAWLTWQGKPGNLPETTGASGRRVLGQFTWVQPRRGRTSFAALFPKRVSAGGK